MDPNREPSGEGTPTGPLNATAGVPSAGYTTPVGDAAPPTQPSGSGYVPPELQPTGEGYQPPPYSSQGEPTRQWSTTTPPTPPPTYTPLPSTAPQPVVERQHGTPVIGPVLLIGAGVVLLLNSMGILDWSVWTQIWQLWPLLLIAIGLSLLLGRRSPVLAALIVLLVLAGGAIFLYAGGGLRPLGPLETVDLNVPLDGAKSANVEISSGIGTLTLDGLDVDETSQLASGRLEYYESWGAPEQTVSRSADEVTLVLGWPDRDFNLGPMGRGPDWDVHLNSQVSLKLKIESGVGETNLDLRQTKATNLDLHAGVGSVNVQFPEQAGTTTAKINGGVGALEITIPDDVEAHITVSSGIGGADVDDRFEEQGEHVYQSSGYATAKNKLDLDVNVGLGGVEIKSR